jgi:hypothetical protein
MQEEACHNKNDSPKTQALNSLKSRTTISGTQGKVFPREATETRLPTYTFEEPGKPPEQQCPRCGTTAVEATNITKGVVELGGEFGTCDSAPLHDEKRTSIGQAHRNLGITPMRRNLPDSSSHPASQPVRPARPITVPSNMRYSAVETPQILT